MDVVGHKKFTFSPSLFSTGINNPLQHGFDTWMGVAYPHNEWCEEQKSVITNQESLLNHPYLKLFYHTSFLWLLLFLFLTMLVWFKVVSIYLYMNLLVYTVSTALAFYILLHLFIVQRSASCVMYRENEIRLQPYDMTNLTLYFTTGASLFLKQVDKPFLMVVNYLKMLPPYVHSPYFSSERTRSPRYYAMQELDWSIGYILERLEEHDFVDDTMVIITGGNSCKRKSAIMDAYQKTSKGFEHVEGMFLSTRSLLGKSRRGFVYKRSLYKTGVEIMTLKPWFSIDSIDI